MNKVIYTQLLFGLGPQVFSSSQVQFYFGLSTIHIYKFNFTVHKRRHQPRYQAAQRSAAEHKMIKYMKPLKLFEECLKRTYHMPSAVFLGLNVSDKSVSLAISDDCYLGGYPFGIWPRDESLVDNLVDMVQNLPYFEYELEGIFISSNCSVTPPMNIHNLMDDLCKKGKFESLKYTYWIDNITSPRAKYYAEQYQQRVFGVPFPLLHHSEQDVVDDSAAVHMLQASLDFFSSFVEREKGNNSDDFEYLEDSE